MLGVLRSYRGFDRVVDDGEALLWGVDCGDDGTELSEAGESSGDYGGIDFECWGVVRQAGCL
jgi:hypothetical protein